jgi:hypothetical protein
MRDGLGMESRGGERRDTPLFFFGYGQRVPGDLVDGTRILSPWVGYRVHIFDSSRPVGGRGHTTRRGNDGFRIFTLSHIQPVALNTPSNTHGFCSIIMNLTLPPPTRRTCQLPRLVYTTAPSHPQRTEQRHTFAALRCKNYPPPLLPLSSNTTGPPSRTGSRSVA